MNEIKIKINDQEFLIKQSFRSYLLFEENTGKQISEIESIKDVFNLLYYTLKGCNKHFNYSFDEFIDIVDENPDIFEKFNELNNSVATEKKTQVKA